MLTSREPATLPDTYPPGADGSPLLPRLPRLAAAVAIAAFAAMALHVALGTPAHHDVAWPLVVAQRVLAGAELYVDVIEVHPPLIVAYAGAAVVLGRVLPVGPIAAYHLITFVLTALSLALCWRVLGHAASAHTRRALLVLAAFLLLPFVGYSFGQEEHLMLALSLPWLLAIGMLRDGREMPARERIVLGVLAGIGISMKPFFGPLWLVLVAYYAARRGPRRILAAEVLAPALVITTYIAATVLLTPGYFTVARMASAVYFDFFPTPFTTVLVSAGTAAALLALLVHFRVRAAGPLSGVRAVLAIALAGFHLAVLVQQKGWSYHWYPVYAAAALLVSCVLADAVYAAAPGAVLRRVAAARAGAVALLLLLGLAAWRVGWTRSHWGDLAGEPFHLPQMTRVVETFGEGGPIAALSVGMPVAFPLVNHAGVEWTPRFACLWMLPGIYADVPPGVGAAGAFPYDRTGALADLDRYVVDSMIEDLRRSPPTLIIVDLAPPMPRMAGFSYLEYFGRDPRFMEFMADYAVIGTVGRYEVWRRAAAG